MAVACTPHNKPTKPTTNQQVDSIYTESDFRRYDDYYNSGHQVYAIDLLSEGLDYDSTGHIVGTGCNLYLSDIFAPKDSIMRLPAGTYTMDSVAKELGTQASGVPFIVIGDKYFSGFSAENSPIEIKEEIKKQVEIYLKYEGYIKKQKQKANKQFFS